MQKQSLMQSKQHEDRKEKLFFEDSLLKTGQCLEPLNCFTSQQKPVSFINDKHIAKKTDKALVHYGLYR